jgi:hypothetical protein
MIDHLGELAGLNRLAEEDGGNLVALRTVIFVPGDYQQTVVGFGELNIGIDVGLQPGVALLDGAVMHVVVQIGHHDGDGGQGGEIRGKAGEGQVARGGHVGEIHPGVVLARVSSGGANR